MTRLHRQTLGACLFTGCGLLALFGTGMSTAQALHRTHALQQTVSTALGWAQSAPRLDEAWTRWDPHRDTTLTTAPTWWATDRLQQAVTQAGVRVVRLEPSTAQTHEPGLKAAVAGSSSAIAVFLQAVPEWVPGITLNHLELVTREQGVECRVELTAPAPPSGGVPA